MEPGKPEKKFKSSRDTFANRITICAQQWIQHGPEVESNIEAKTEPKQKLKWQTNMSKRKLDQLPESVAKHMSK